MLVVNSPYGIFENGHITITQLIILVDKCFLGFGVTFVGKFLGLEQVHKLARLMDFTK